MFKCIKEIKGRQHHLAIFGSVFNYSKYVCERQGSGGVFVDVIVFQQTNGFRGGFGPIQNYSPTDIILVFVAIGPIKKESLN